MKRHTTRKYGFSATAMVAAGCLTVLTLGGAAQADHDHYRSPRGGVSITFGSHSHYKHHSHRSYRDIEFDRGHALGFNKGKNQGYYDALYGRVYCTDVVLGGRYSKFYREGFRYGFDQGYEAGFAKGKYERLARRHRYHRYDRSYRHDDGRRGRGKGRGRHRGRGRW